MAFEGYAVAVGATPDDLAAEVTALAGAGYVPIGGLGMDAAQGVYTQACVKGTLATGMPGAASTSTAGIVKQAVAVTDAGDGDIKDQLNALLAALRTSGALASS